jgi:hypothetical protein
MNSYDFMDVSDSRKVTHRRLFFISREAYMVRSVEHAI